MKNIIKRLFGKGHLSKEEMTTVMPISRRGTQEFVMLRNGELMPIFRTGKVFQHAEPVYTYIDANGNKHRQSAS